VDIAQTYDVVLQKVRRSVASVPQPLRAAIVETGSHGEDRWIAIRDIVDAVAPAQDHS
jgi:hypothetical protein